MANNSTDNKKTLLIASDIFGLSESFLSLLEDINIPEQAIIVSPYQQPQPCFENEQQAYECFQKHGGIDAYIVSLTHIFTSHTGITKVIGFSAGAAAMYKVMSNLSISDVALYLFYPGQIRYFLDQHPSSPCHIIFPDSESHFSLPDVTKVLKQQSNVVVEQNTYHHGFMNKDSKGFDQTAYYYYCQMLNELLTGIKS